MNEIRVEMNGVDSGETRVFVGDREISNIIQSVVVNSSVGQPNMIQIQFILEVKAHLAFPITEDLEKDFIESVNRIEKLLKEGKLADQDPVVIFDPNLGKAS